LLGVSVKTIDEHAPLQNQIQSREPRALQWPSLQEQLTQDKVVAGSALDRLIRDNQDFSLLRPEEAHDDLGLPIWFRVLWHKNYPDARSYPLVLRDTYRWVLSHQDLQPSSESDSTLIDGSTSVPPTR